ncbi:MAG: class I SAM-dependent methyltransferase [Ignavibacteria bacterium]|nr:class I SAM-dependent methyltransferase [Ignavibacteria bacterium]
MTISRDGNSIDCVEKIYSLHYSFFMQLVSHLISFFENDINYWKKRVRNYGKRSVLNIAHTEEEYEIVTQKQKDEIYPLFKSQLNGTERTVLDFGCGPGRFTNDLASMIQGKAIGVDPIAEILSFASNNADVSYKVMDEGKIPLDDCSADIVWCCLVLGGIKNKILKHTVKEINRVLNKHGLLFLIENTSEKPSGKHWVFRSVAEYQNYFSMFELSPLHNYDDVGERISILAGRK